MHFCTLVLARAQNRALRDPAGSRALRVCLGLSLALAVTGCTVHAHTEYHTGTGGKSSAGAEAERPNAPGESGAHHEGRQSPAGRDNVVRVTAGSKPAVEQGNGAREPSRTVVRPTGDVPASSGAGSAAAGGAGGAGAAGGSNASGGENGQPSAEAPPKGTDSAPAQEEKPGENTASTGKGTRKNPSEPHVVTPVRKPRKEQRTSDGASTNKEGGRE